jgi:hypothetical protein
VAGSREYNVPSGSIKDREFLDQMNYYQLLKKNSTERHGVMLLRGWEVPGSNLTPETGYPD